MGTCRSREAVLEPGQKQQEEPKTAEGAGAKNEAVQKLVPPPSSGKKAGGSTKKTVISGTKGGALSGKKSKKRGVERQLGELRDELVWERRTREFEEVYETVKMIGEGAMGSVLLVQKKSGGNRSVGRRNDLDAPRSGTESGVALGWSVSSAYPSKKAALIHQYAAKIILFKDGHRTSSKKRIAELRHEIDVLRTLDHPSIVHLREAFWEPQRLVLVMELCEGVMLTKLAGRCTEATVCEVSRQLLQALAYLHSHHVVHRDLKLDNVMMQAEHLPSSQGSGGDREMSYSSTACVPQIVVKLIDFGLSRQARKASDPLCKIDVAAAGTLSTAAPEVVAGGLYDYPADVWSLGACAYKFVGGCDPFLLDHVEPDAESIRRLEAAKIPWQPTCVWSKHSKQCREFVYNCMRAKVSSRWAPSEALAFVLENWFPNFFGDNEDWPKDGVCEDVFIVSTPSATFDTSCVDDNEKGASWSLLQPSGELVSSVGGDSKPSSFLVRRPQVVRSNSSHALSPRVLHGSIQRFASYSDLKRAALLVAAHHVDHRRTAKLRRAFMDLDSDHSGEVSVDELCRALRQVAPDADVASLFESLDYDESGVVRYHEFLAATIDDDLDILDDEALRDAFDRLDDDDTGVITTDNLKHILGNKATDDLVQRMIRDGDLKQNGGIDFDEFLALMRPEHLGVVNFGPPDPSASSCSSTSNHHQIIPGHASPDTCASSPAVPPPLVQQQRATAV